MARTAHDTATREETVQLVESARAGDQDAFTSLYRRHVSDLTGAVVSILRNRHDAEEVVHDTFLLAWQRLDTLTDPAAFGGWLVRIGRNRALNRRRKELRSRPYDGTTIAESFDFADHGHNADPARVAEANADRTLVWAAARGLGERDRRALTLSLHKESGPTELAAALGIKANLASQILHRLRGRMASAIHAWTLWAEGRPSCVALGAHLTHHGVDEFDADAVTAINRHSRTCADCSAHADHHELAAA